MAGKWFPETHHLVGLDFFLGIGIFAFQVAFYSTYKAVTSYDLAGTGIWAGIIFVITSLIMWTKIGKLNKLILLIGPCLSFISGIVLFGLTVAALNDFAEGCPIKWNTSSGQVKYHCSTEIGLDVMLMLCGLLAIPVNGLLCFVVLSL